MKKVIKIFVSSTFNDMHRERDLLRPIEGLINRDIADTGYSIQLVDLRYGIDTSTDKEEIASEKKVLENCFQIISECQLFLLLVGDRYGTVFNDVNLSIIPLKYEEAKGKSVTHLELSYAVQSLSNRQIFAFIRNNKDIDIIPDKYIESAKNKEKNEELRRLLKESDYRIDYYKANIVNGEYEIDEYYFKKHALGILKRMVLEYIEDSNQYLITGFSDEVVRNENQILINEIERKTSLIQNDYKTVYEKLLLFRVTNLLLKSDYEIINSRGGNGRAQLEYRVELIKKMPENIEELLWIILESIAMSINDSKNYISSKEIYNVLIAMAIAQNDILYSFEGLSSNEIYYILGISSCIGEINRDQNKIDDLMLYSKYNEIKGEISVTLRQTSQISNALAYLVQSDIIKYNDGYSLADDVFVDYLKGKCTQEQKERVNSYFNSIWWYSTHRCENLLKLIFKRDFLRIYDVLKKLKYAKEVYKCIHEYCEKNINYQELSLAIFDYLNWCLDEGKSVLEVINWLYSVIYTTEDYDVYIKVWVPLAEKVYNKMKSLEKQSLSYMYAMNFIYDEFSTEQNAPQNNVLEQDVVIQLGELGDAIWEMFFCGIDDTKQKKDALTVIRKYYNDWDSVLDIIQMYMITHGMNGYTILYNFISEYLDGNLSEEAYTKLISVAIKSVFSCEDLINDYGKGLSFIFQYVAEILYDNNMINTCLYLVHELYDVVDFETVIRRCDWTIWINYMYSDLLEKLYFKTKDKTVGTILNTISDFFGVYYEDFIKFDVDEMNKRTLIDEV